MTFRRSFSSVNSAGHPRTRGLAKVIFHEIAGMVNDMGAMKSKLTPQEIESRGQFKEGDKVIGLRKTKPNE